MITEMTQVKNRIGRLRIPEDIFKDIDATFVYVKEVFGQFVPATITKDPFKPYYEYKGVSPAFDEIEEGAEIPEYQIVITEYRPEPILDWGIDVVTVTQDTYYKIKFSKLS